MSTRSMALDVLVRLRDNFSGPMRRLKGNLDQISSFAKRIGVVGAAIAGISFLGPIQEAAAFQQKMLDIAGTTNLVGAEAFAFADQTGAKFEALALRIGQASDTVTDGAGQMIAAGVEMGVIDRNIEKIGRSATAANAEFSDLASVATSLINTLKVPESELEGALAGLTVAGKQGAFELKDMARYFPQLTGQMAKFGIAGREASDQIASLLQIARMGTSDPGIAANNLNNFLSKALAPITQKNFKEMGVDIEAVMMDAVAKGINPIEAMIQKVGKLTGVSADQVGKFMATAKKQGLEGADAIEAVRQQLEKVGGASKLGELFGDQQVLDFLIPMLANIEEYKRIKAEVSAATGQVIDADFETQIQGDNRQLTIMREIGTQSVRAVGSAFAEWLPMINGALLTALSYMRDLDASSGGMVKRALTLGGGVLVVAAALGTLGFVLPVVTAGLGAIGALVGVLLSPIGLLVGALAAGGAYIYQNWERFGPRLGRLWQRAKGVFSDFANSAVSRGREMIGSGRELAERYGPMIADGLSRGWQRAVDLGRTYGPMIAGATRQFFADFATGASGIGESTDRLLATLRSMGPAFTQIFGDLGTILSREFENAKTTFNNIAQIFGGDESFGAILGREAKNAVDTFGNLAEGMKAVVEAIAQITAAVAGGEPIPWRNILPTGVVDAYDEVVSKIEAVKTALAAFRDWLSSFSLPSINLSAPVGSAARPGEILPNGTPAGDPDKDVGGMGEDRFNALGDFGKTPPLPPAPDRRSALPSSSRFAAIQPRQPLKLDGNVGVTVKVDGPGKVTNVASDNSMIRPEGGRTVGRA